MKFVLIAYWLMWPPSSPPFYEIEFYEMPSLSLCGEVGAKLAKDYEENPMAEGRRLTAFTCEPDGRRGEDD